MFVALQVLPQSGESVAAKLRRILKKPKVTAEIHELLGVRFAVVRAEAYSNGQPDWDEVKYVAKEYSRWLVLPEDMTVHFPADSSLRVFSPVQFDRTMLLHTACKLIHRSRMPMYRRVLAMLDDDGNAADMLYELLKYFTSVKVVTKNVARYRIAAECMMDELGAPVAVGTELSGVSDCVLAIAPNGFASEENTPLPCPVLTLREDSIKLKCRCETISRPAASLPDGVIAPDGVSPHLIAAAMYTLCGVHGTPPVAQRMLYVNQYIGFEQMIKFYCLRFLT